MTQFHLDINNPNFETVIADLMNEERLTKNLFRSVAEENKTD